MNPKAHPRHAFTLIELLTVIAIIGILASLVLAGLRTVRSKAHQSHCVANLREVGRAILLYTDENKGRLPGPTNVRVESAYRAGEQGLAILIGPYLGYPAPSNNRTHVPQLRCPARPFDPSQFANEATYIVQCRMRKLSNGTSTGAGRPFGKLNGDPGQETPIPFSELEAHGGAAQVWAIMEADQQVPWSALSSAWKDRLPQHPAHGGSRTTLYFDGHVALLTQLPQ
jgi:prepilin-type N-terminal cleavage/methylation domain